MAHDLLHATRGIGAVRTMWDEDALSKRYAESFNAQLPCSISPASK